MHTALWLVLAAGTALASCVHSVGQPQDPGGVAAPQPAGEQAARGEFRSAEELLDALERSGDSLETLVAEIKYDRIFTIQGDRQVRVGKLYFVGGKPDAADASRRTGRKFAIHFNQLQLGDQRRPDDRVYIFDGEMLTEKIAADKLILKKRIVEPGESFDPLKIGEGPMPIPIGQKKQDILERYDAELLPPAQGMDPAAVEDPDVRQQMEIIQRVAPGTWQLRLTPKDPEDDFREIRLWYARGEDGGLIPRMARTVNRADDVSFVQLINIETQTAGGETNKAAAIPASVFDVSVPAGWIEQVDDLRDGER